MTAGYKSYGVNCANAKLRATGPQAALGFMSRVSMVNRQPASEYVSLPKLSISVGELLSQSDGQFVNRSLTKIA
eukprot:scaffold60995_cov25-Prasinocladus_malaysianus.AAC.1